ncbi:putative Lysosome membrane protein [Naja naja]|nr:putative Lysosome membrane protein [Naja naja]
MKRFCLVTLGLLAPACLIAGIALLAARIMENLVDGQIKQETILRNNSEVFEFWEHPPIPLLLQVYFFNLTNPLEVLQGEIPIVREVGPYTYREWKSRRDVHILENGSKVSSFQPSTYYFERELSVGDPETAMNMARWTPFHFPAELMLLAYQEDMFTIHTVEEILWGYTDKFLKTLHKFFPNVDPVFGYFKEMNATDDGEYVMLSGEKNYLDFTRVIEWNGKDKLDWWTTPSCNMINGTDGETFHSLISKDERIYIFSTDFCRLKRLGIPTHRFAPPLEIFANISVNPDNAGFCVPAGHCEGSGILNVTGCKKGPRYCYRPPISSILRTRMPRCQTGNIKTMPYPVLFVNESFVLDDENSGCLLESSLVQAVPYILLALGIICGAVFLAVTYWPKGKKEELPSFLPSIHLVPPSCPSLPSSPPFCPFLSSSLPPSLPSFLPSSPTYLFILGERFNRPTGVEISTGCTFWRMAQKCLLFSQALTILSESSPWVIQKRYTNFSQRRSSFGYFKEMNATDDGEYVMLSGEKNYLDFTRVIEWNGKDKLDWWTTPSCNMINGTDGETFHSLISKDERIYIFSTDFCRSLYLTFEEDLSVLGIPTYRFAPPLEIFANISVNPDNAGFCVPAGHCEGSGILNGPRYCYRPHFLHSEDTMPRCQTGNIKTMPYPVLFVNESFVLDDVNAGKLRAALLESSLVQAVPYILLALGIICGAVFLAVTYWPKGKKEELPSFLPSIHLVPPSCPSFLPPSLPSVLFFPPSLPPFLPSFLPHLPTCSF